MFRLLEKALNPETGYDPDGISSLDWYLGYYGTDAQINESRWNGSGFAEKLEKIRRIYTVRLDFLTEALGLYDTDYIYFYKENGILYGVKCTGRVDSGGKSMKKILELCNQFLIML